MTPKPAKKPPAAELEYCELCHHHHDLGRRHRYGRNHRKNLGKVLTSFSSKLSDLRRALLDGSPSSQAPRPRIWCPFCSTELIDLDNSSACSNAIYHLASGEHLKGVKDFLWKHGGGMDQVDSLRISEDELGKWEKDYESLSKGAKTGTEGLIGPSLGPMNAMGHTTLLVQHVMELSAPEVFLILLHMELLDWLSHLGDRPKHMSNRVCCLQTVSIVLVLKWKVINLLSMEMDQAHRFLALHMFSKVTQEEI